MEWSPSFEGDSDSVPCLFYLSLYVVLLQCIDFSGVYFTATALFVHDCAPFIRKI